MRNVGHHETQGTLQGLCKLDYSSSICLDWKLLFQTIHLRLWWLCQIQRYVMRCYCVYAVSNGGSKRKRALTGSWRLSRTRRASRQTLSLFLCLVHLTHGVATSSQDQRSQSPFTPHWRLVWTRPLSRRIPPGSSTALKRFLFSGMTCKTQWEETVLSRQ